MTAANAPYKVVLVFHLKPGTADTELQRSQSDDSFPGDLSREEGFLGLELVKLGPERTMSIQTWRSERDWWTALEKIKQARASRATPPEEDLLVSRDFFGGSVIAARAPAAGRARTDAGGGAG